MHRHSGHSFCVQRKYSQVNHRYAKRPARSEHVDQSNIWLSLRIAARISSADNSRSSILGSDFVALRTARATPTPKDASAPLSKSVSAKRRLYLVRSVQTNFGASSRIREVGSRPSFLARENRSSFRAEGEVSASSLHQSGQAALIADWEKPAARSDARSAFPVAANCRSTPLTVSDQAPPAHQLL